MKKLFLLGLSIALTACGPTTKVWIEGTRDSITVTTSQSVTDSSSVNVQINPNLNFAK